jgi:hypothetical protein
MYRLKFSFRKNSRISDGYVNFLKKNRRACIPELHFVNHYASASESAFGRARQRNRESPVNAAEKGDLACVFC